jgi:hypothetical protein
VSTPRQIAQMSDDYSDIKQQVTAYQYNQRASLILAYELEGTDVQFAPIADTGQKEGEKEEQKFHHLHFFKKPSTWRRREFLSYSMCIVSMYIHAAFIAINCVRTENDQIESAWTNGSDRKLDKVQETVVKLSVRSKRLPGRWQLNRMLRKNQEETDKKVNQLDTKVEEKVTELKDQIEGLKKSMKTDMDSILQALRQMRPEPEPEA